MAITVLAAVVAVIRIWGIWVIVIREGKYQKFHARQRSTIRIIWFK